MKKSLLILLLAVALVVPGFAAEKGSMEIVGKLGLNLIPKVDASGNFVDKGGFIPTSGPFDRGKGKSDVGMAVLIGGEFFCYLNKNIALGFGINNNFNADLKDTKHNKGEVGFTNFYFAVKPTMELQSEIVNSLYLMGQIGYGLFRFNNHRHGTADGNGLYLGIGAGTEIYKNFIVELLYSANKGSMRDTLGFGDTADLTYTTLTLNVGYKFSL